MKVTIFLIVLAGFVTPIVLVILGSDQYWIIYAVMLVIWVISEVRRHFTQ